MKTIWLSRCLSFTYKYSFTTTMHHMVCILWYLESNNAHPHFIFLSFPCNVLQDEGQFLSMLHGMKEIIKVLDLLGVLQCILPIQEKIPLPVHSSRHCSLGTCSCIAFNIATPQELRVYATIRSRGGKSHPSIIHEPLQVLKESQVYNSLHIEERTNKSKQKIWHRLATATHEQWGG